SEEEVERFLALPSPPPSPLISLSPPSAEERLARCLGLHLHFHHHHSPEYLTHMIALTMCVYLEASELPWVD
ncbi:hypothetical protein Tco_0518514, partial [Tanacetum coccineum]